MKTLLLSILLAIISLVSNGQTTSGTTTQNAALKAFEDAFLTTDWGAKTNADQDAFNRTWTGLKIAAAKEAEANRLAAIASQTAAEQAAATAATAEKQAFIDKLKSLGFLCDNSLADWKKLFNYPEIQGSTWEQKATYQQSISTGLDYFLQFAKDLLYQTYAIGKAYKIGDVFVYNGELYKVLQPHTSQADWLPNLSTSLYLKATVPGTIAAFKQPTGSTDAYKKGDKVTFNGSTYESLIDANVWSPSAYPSGWKLIN